MLKYLVNGGWTKKILLSKGFVVKFSVNVEIHHSVVTRYMKSS